MEKPFARELVPVVEGRLVAVAVRVPVPVAV